MKKIWIILLVAVMVLSLAACGGGDDEKTPSSDDKTPSSSQQQEQTDKPVENEPEQKPEPAAEPEFEKEPAEEKTVPTTGTPLDWPENDYTKLVPTPNCGTPAPLPKVVCPGCGKEYDEGTRFCMDCGSRL